VKTIDIIQKMVLGTAQFGMNYGIANASGKPTKAEVFDILELAWGNGVRRFDTAPGYGSEVLLGDFILANGIQDEAIVLTKIPSIDRASCYQKSIRSSLETSLNNLRCSVEVYFFHNPADSCLLLTDSKFFENLLRDHPVSTLGVSVYETKEVESLSGYSIELAFQFPFNVLDRRFEKLNLPKLKRYARSVFLQGLLASTNDLRTYAPKDILNLQKEYHNRLAKYDLDPISFAVSFVAHNDAVDYFLFGVDSAKQLKEILELEPYEKKDKALLNTLQVSTPKKWLDPRQWN